METHVDSESKIGRREEAYTVEEAGIRAVDSVIEFRADNLRGFLGGVDSDRRIEAAGVARGETERRRKQTWRASVERIEAMIKFERQD